MKKVLLLLPLCLLLLGCQKMPQSLAAPEETLQATQIPQAAPTAAPTEAATEAPTTAPTQPQPERFTLTFAGDCTLGCNVHHMYAGMGFIKTVGEDYGYPFANVLEYFENDDFTMVNLEGPLADSGNPRPKKHAFRGPTAFVNILTQGSVEGVSLGNNHTMDYGEAAYASTLSTLEEVGIQYVERDSATLFTTDSGLTIGLYAMTYYLLDVQDMTQEIAQLRQQGAEVVIVAPHWGVEGTFHPTQEQMDVGRAAIDAGADIVFGTHPHVLQPIEHYHDGVIFYSLGNFSFGGNIYPKDYDSALIQQEILRDDQGITLGELTIVPVNLSSEPTKNNFQPTPYPPGSEEYNRVLTKLDGSYSGPNLPAD